MEENSRTQASPAAPPEKLPRQTPGPAFASAVIPGLGQLALGEKWRGIIYFTLLAIWIFLFFPPVQSPRNWTRWGNQELGGILLASISTYQALRSKAGGKRPGNPALLIALLPLAAITMAGGHHFLTRTAGFQDYRVSGNAMQPTLENGDTIVVSLHEYRHREPSRGEIVIARSPAGEVIKRVIAEGGDTIAGKNG